MDKVLVTSMKLRKDGERHHVYILHSFEDRFAAAEFL